MLLRLVRGCLTDQHGIETLEWMLIAGLVAGIGLALTSALVGAVGRIATAMFAQ